MADGIEVTEVPPRSMGVQFAKWLLAASVGMCLLALGAARAPERIRLLILFAVAFGALSGWALGQLARALDMNSPRLIAGISWVLIFAGLLGSMWLMHRAVVAKWKDHFRKDPMAQAMKNLPAAGEDESPESRAAREDMERSQQELVEFSTHLKHRVKQLGNWNSPFPAIFWGFEVFLGSAVGAWLAFRTARVGVKPSGCETGPTP